MDFMALGSLGMSARQMLLAAGKPVAQLAQNLEQATMPPPGQGSDRHHLKAQLDRREQDLRSIAEDEVVSPGRPPYQGWNPLPSELRGDRVQNMQVTLRQTPAHMLRQPPAILTSESAFDNPALTREARSQLRQQQSDTDKMAEGFRDMTYPLQLVHPLTWVQASQQGISPRQLLAGTLPALTDPQQPMSGPGRVGAAVVTSAGYLVWDPMNLVGTRAPSAQPIGESLHSIESVGSVEVFTPPTATVKSARQFRPREGGINSANTYHMEHGDLGHTVSKIEKLDQHGHSETGTRSEAMMSDLDKLLPSTSGGDSFAYPHTELRRLAGAGTHPEGLYSHQQFLHDYQTVAHTDSGRLQDHPDWVRVQYLGQLSGHPDMHGNNVMVHRLKGTPKLIDGGFAFDSYSRVNPLEPYLRSDVGAGLHPSMMADPVGRRRFLQASLDYAEASQKCLSDHALSEIAHRYDAVDDYRASGYMDSRQVEEMLRHNRDAIPPMIRQQLTQLDLQTNRAHY